MVQRPASVVKELVENSVDSGATRIVVTIENGGRDLIQVMDNGSGMDEDDLLLAFEQHATSKIRVAEDLDGIRTLGFRGEALSSIAAISMVTARSASTDSGEGREIMIHGGDIQSVQAYPMQRGSFISVKKIFYNTPARRKFLKSASTEYRYIVDTVRRFSLCHPELEFQLFSGDKDVFNLRPASLKERIVKVFANHYEDKLIKISAEDGPIALEGYVGNLDLVRNKSGEQYLFVNDRLVTDRMMNSAVYQAFNPMVEKGEFPFFVLKLYLPPSEVDVNVHPQKTEIKYRQDWMIYQFIRKTIAMQLENNLTVVPTFNHNPRFQSGGLYAYNADVSPAGNTYQVEQLGLNMPEDRKAAIPEPAPLPKGHPLEERINKFKESLEENEELTDPSNIISIWQAHNKYIFAQIASGVVIIDQHAAHERILFEKALNTLQKASAQASQRLLFPVTLNLSPDDFSYLADVLDEFEKLGFSMREFGRDTILIEAVPADLRYVSEGNIVLEILDHFKNSHKAHNQKQYNMAASYACKAAIKAGDRLEPGEMQQLVDELFQTTTPYACPHGRPTIIHLTMNELDKRFHRI